MQSLFILVCDGKKMSKIKPSDIFQSALQELKNDLALNNDGERARGNIVVNVTKILEENRAYLGITSFYENNRMTSSQFISTCKSFQKCLNQVNHLELSGNQL